MKRMKKGDFVVIGLIIIISLVMLYYYSQDLGPSKGDKYISIQIEGKEVEKIFFEPDVIGKKIPIVTKYGYNILEVGEDSCRVVEADCPDQIDVLQGRIYEEGEMLVCLPHRLIIEIKTVDGEQELDIINR